MFRIKNRRKNVYRLAGDPKADRKKNWGPRGCQYETAHRLQSHISSNIVYYQGMGQHIAIVRGDKAVAMPTYVDALLTRDENVLTEAMQPLMEDA